jgi:hypothetical protein
MRQRLRHRPSQRISQSLWLWLKLRLRLSLRQRLCLLPRHRPRPRLCLWPRHRSRLQARQQPRLQTLPSPHRRHRRCVFSRQRCLRRR